MLETGEDVDRTDEVKAIDAEIETLQGRILELNKQRARREIDAEKYNTDSREVMVKLDSLFEKRETIEAEKSTATLSKQYQAIVADYLSRAASPAVFDEDVFTRLVDKVIVKDRDDITFILKDGMEVRAETAE